LTAFGESVSVRAVKLLLPLLALTLFVTACSSSNAPRRELWASSGEGGYSASGGGGHSAGGSRRPLFGSSGSGYGYSDSNATRRDLYSPSHASGPYTRSLDDGSWRDNGKSVDQEMQERREQQRINVIETKTSAKPQ
jgi:hypothetical protein